VKPAVSIIPAPFFHIILLFFKMERRFLLLSFFITVFSFQEALFGQGEPVSGGIGMNPGAFFKLKGKNGTAPDLCIRLDGRIPILSPILSTTLHTGWEYCILRTEKNLSGNTLQTARAQYLRAGMNLNLRLYTTRKQTGLELGGGILFRRKFYESSDWQLTGGLPNTYFPKTQVMAPVQLVRFAENDKRRINIFAEVIFNTETKNNAIGGMNAGIQWQWFAKQRKQYFKGTHRTLQWDDIWPAQPF